MTVFQASQAHSEAVGRPHSEADSDVNDTARAVITAMFQEHGRAVLVSLNYAPEGEPKVREWDGESIVYNFGADAVLPVHSADLRGYIQQRDAAEYSTARDVCRIREIHALIEELGGEILMWS